MARNRRGWESDPLLWSRDDELKANKDGRRAYKASVPRLKEKHRQDLTPKSQGEAVHSCWGKMCIASISGALFCFSVVRNMLVLVFRESKMTPFC